MTYSTLNYRFCYPKIDRPAVIDFLSSQKEELFLQDDATVNQVIDVAFEKGGVFAGFDASKTVHSMLGFFFGDPNENYANKNIVFMYVAAISNEYRLTRAFHSGLRQVLIGFQEMGLSSIRLQAKSTDRYVNKLYNRFAQPIGEGFSLRGQPVTTYGGSIDEALAYYRPKNAIPEFQHAPSNLSAKNAQHAAGLRAIQI